VLSTVVDAAAAAVGLRYTAAFTSTAAAVCPATFATCTAGAATVTGITAAAANAGTAAVLRLLQAPCSSRQEHQPCQAAAVHHQLVKRMLHCAASPRSAALPAQQLCWKREALQLWQQQQLL
jgi:cellulase/cellobiase CelA1